MPTPRRAASRLIAVAPLVITLPACASWRVQQGSAQQVIETRQPERARVTTTEGEQIVLHQPRAMGGILRGYDASCWEALGARSDDCPEVGFLLSDVHVVEILERDTRTLLIPAVVIMATMVYLVTGI